MNAATFRAILGLLSRGERRRGAVVVALMIGLAFSETISVASVIPFLAVLGNPEIVETNDVFAWLKRAGGFTSSETFLYVLGIGAFVVVVGASIFRAFTQYVMFRFVNMRRHTIGLRLLQSYLRQPYSFFLQRNPAELSKLILSEADQLVQNVYRPGIQMISYGLVAVVLAVFLVALDPMLALLVSGALAGVYALIYVTVRPLLGRIGTERVRTNQDRFTAVSETLGGIKAVKLSGSERAFLDRFSRPSEAFARYQSVAETLSTVPKFLIEAVGLGGVLLLALMLMRTHRDLGSVLPVLGLYAFAGYRLLPAAQNVYAGFARLRFGVSVVGDLYREMNSAQSRQPVAPKADPALVLREALELRDVTYAYPGSQRAAVRGVSLSIAAGTSAAFVGSTGSGKTTIIDLIIGLLEPTTGYILIDGAKLDSSSLRAWQRTIGYVPQDIYLADTSVLENIAFGLPKKDIDLEAAQRAARSACIHDFIVNELPRGYETLVGDRGIRLSGGQRQRIGIARALYHNPSVLVLDEATSALDSETERAIVEALAGLGEGKTLIMIAHRLSSVQRCDRIFVLDQGALVGDGCFEELMRTNARFRRLAGSQPLPAGTAAL